MRNTAILPSIVTGCLITMGVGADAAECEKAILIKQRSNVAGKCEVLIAKNGFKATLPERRLALLMVAPKWGLRLLNLKDKLYFDVDPNKWVPPELFATAMYRTASFRMLKTSCREEAPLMGLSATLNHVYGTQYPRGKVLGKWQKLEVANGEYYTLKDARIPASAAAVMEKLFAVPTTGMLPLQLKAVNHKNSAIDELILENATKVDCKPTDFAVASNFKAGKNESEVVLNSGADSMLGELTGE